ncbi:YaaC family protein [Caldibacillus thermoamylovorans]|uniref:YaaC family protein n=1 Tax=Caldibacillus thermoamylovorans TaxID=35841 RepID=UPI001D091572|nr:YaaC family protein [Caldibacillus thermoamylovorans]MCB5936687.1 YaaC family protein [Bacillus sp. DFI.2.34]MCB7078162.1 YaaC family protein [Caldibacillus thermoamylovorans]
MSASFSSSLLKKYLYLSSEETSRQFLFHTYNKRKIIDAKKKSYENSFSFISYIEQGITFFEQTERSSLNIKPILLFYGLVFLLKACVLSVDPDYPESSLVLAHGVSTRKRKKQNYIYLKDEVKLQKNGLFPHFSDKMFHMKHLEGKKLTVESLLKEIPELIDYFAIWTGHNHGLPIDYDGKYFSLPESVLDFFKMTSDRFKTFFQSNTNKNIQFIGDPSIIKFYIEENQSTITEILPFRFHIEKHSYFLLQNDKELSFYPELMIHYLILYHLGMIARYEIEWWSELIHHKPSIEYPLIVQYLNISTKKIPLLIDQYLWSYFHGQNKF